MKENEITEDLMQMIKESSCSFTTVAYAEKILAQHGYRRLSMEETWEIQPGGKYMVNLYDSGLLAFAAGKKDGRLKLAAAHTDQPSFVLKPSPEMRERAYGKLNVEVYGGPILNTWLDRPLSIAGKVVLQSGDVFAPETRIVDCKVPVAVIPNLAIHLNRNVNKGVELNRQTDMLPLCTMLGEKMDREEFFLTFLAEKLETDREKILEYELYLYNREESCILGLGEEFLLAPRLDNLTSVQACIKAMCQEFTEGLTAICLYDNEEIGSMTKQGADSGLVAMLLERIYISLGYSREAYLEKLSGGFMLSLDVAHAHHPNHPEKSDPVNKNLLNAGIVIKRAAKQTYATDSTSISVVEQICKKAQIPYQKYAVRSDGTTGSTLGSIANKYLPMRIVDIGVPVLAMHSAMELMGRKDQMYMEKFVENFMKE